MPNQKRSSLSIDADVLGSAINKYRRNRRLRSTLRSLLAVLSVLSILFLILIYSPLRTIVDLARVTIGSKYLVVFANDAELRPSGGFIGSFAVVDASNILPKVEYVETNIYAKDNRFEKNSFVTLPEPLQENLGKDKSWTLHDSNWDPDFRVSAQYIKWFYEKEYDDNIDGVILINTVAIKRLLQYTGSIKHGSDKELSSDNIYELLGNSVENDYWADPRNEEINKPKSIIAELEPILLRKTYSMPFGKILKYVRTTLSRKEIVFWSGNANQQSIISSNNWAGNIDPSQIFISSNNATVGTKSSQNINETLLVDISSTDNLIAIKERREQTKLDGQFGGGENVSFSQIILPPESKIESYKINGIENIFKAYIQDNGRYASVGSWTKIDKGQPLNIEVLGKLPSFNPNQPLCIYKQVGSQNKSLEIKIDNVSVFNGELEKDVCVEK